VYNVSLHATKILRKHNTGNRDKKSLGTWAEIAEALLSQFSLLADFFIVKEPVKD
jgi:hypothetical protein